MAVIAVTGGGARALTWVLGVPGASNTVLEAIAPYSEASLTEFLGREPTQAVSDESARDMAKAAYVRALRLRTDGAPVAGIGCTATISTDRPKRGDHRCHVSAWTEGGVTTYSVLLSKGLRDRSGEDDVVSMLVVRALAEAFEVGFPLSLGLDDGERVTVDAMVYDDPIKALMAGHVSSVTVQRDGILEADCAVGPALLPGSFDPLHQGHVELTKVAGNMLESEVSYELSVTNVDKPPLSEEEVRARIAQFRGSSPVVITRAPVFHEKARLFPGRTFVIGADTADRLVNTDYYGGSTAGMLVALDEIRRLGCRFLVAGRSKNGTFRTLSDIPIPEEFADLFTDIPKSRFRSETSSTDLRRAGRRS